MSKQYKETMKGLGDRLKKEEVKIPIQEVRPVADPAQASTTKPATPKEAHVNFWVPDKLMERIKIHAAVSRKSIKEIGIEALEMYLKESAK